MRLIGEESHFYIVFQCLCCCLGHRTFAYLGCLRTRRKSTGERKTTTSGGKSGRRGRLGLLLQKPTVELRPRLQRNPLQWRSMNILDPFRAFTSYNLAQCQSLEVKKFSMVPLDIKRKKVTVRSAPPKVMTP